MKNEDFFAPFGTSRVFSLVAALQRYVIGCLQRETPGVCNPELHVTFQCVLCLNILKSSSFKASLRFLRSSRVVSEAGSISFSTR